MSPRSTRWAISTLRGLLQFVGPPAVGALGGEHVEHLGPQLLQRLGLLGVREAQAGLIA